MSRHRDETEVERLIREVAALDPADEGDVVSARRVLEKAVRAETEALRTRRRLIWTGAAGAAVVALALLIPRVDTLDPNGTTLGEIAERAAATTHSVPDPSQFVFTSSDVIRLVQASDSPLPAADIDAFPYLLTERHLTWQGDAVIHEQVTVVAPSFFTPANEEVYYQIGLDEIDRVGETMDLRPRPILFNKLEIPVEKRSKIDSLLEAVTRIAEAEGRPTLEVLLQLIQETSLEGDLRSAAIEALARLEVDVIDRNDDSTKFDGTLDGERIEFSLDGQGRLIELAVLRPAAWDGQVPEGTPLRSITFSEPILVSDLGSTS